MTSYNLGCELRSRRILIQTYSGTFIYAAELLFASLMIFWRYNLSSSSSDSDVCKKSLDINNGGINRVHGDWLGHSSFSFWLMTFDCRCFVTNMSVTLQSLKLWTTKMRPSQMQSVVDELANWSGIYHMNINGKRQKEMILSPLRSHIPPPLTITWPDCRPSN